MNKPVNRLLQKEMTRKEFMATLGFGAASLMGFGSIIRLLSGGETSQSSGQKVSRGYGSSSYGN
jgi:hypothetical protein